MKRKPDQTITHRIELQSKEREIIQDYLMMEQANKLIRSITNMIGNLTIEQMYGWLTLFEAMGWLDTPIPTISDADEMAAAFVSWAVNGNQNRQEEAEQRDQYGEEQRAGYVPPDDPSYIYTGGGGGDVSGVPRYSDDDEPEYGSEDWYRQRSPGGYPSGP